MEEKITYLQDVVITELQGELTGCQEEQSEQNMLVEHLSGQNATLVEEMNQEALTYQSQVAALKQQSTMAENKHAISMREMEDSLNTIKKVQQADNDEIDLKNDT